MGFIMNMNLDLIETRFREIREAIGFLNEMLTKDFEMLTIQETLDQIFADSARRIFGYMYADALEIW